MLLCARSLCLVCFFCAICSICMSGDHIAPLDLILVSAGTTSADNGNISVQDDFYIAKNHVTQGQFAEIMGFNPSNFNNSPNNPVDSVTWFDALMFCNKLSEAHGLVPYYHIHVVFRSPNGNIMHAAFGLSENPDANGYRLPTIVEHEYAARGGKNGRSTLYAGSDDIGDVAWYWDNSNTESNSNRSNNRGPMPVGSKRPNELGIYDMCGNVWDWTYTSHDALDWRFCRGGSWFDKEDKLKLSFSRGNRPGYRNYNVGFRVAKDR